MAPKRKKSQRDAPPIEEGSYTDFKCPICLELLIEPVLLPCQHEVCSACLEPHLVASSLCCPLCRKRISNWVRDSRKNNTSLVNERRWALIQEKFPDRVKRRLQGLGDIEDDVVPKRRIASDGELREEYEAEIQKIEKEKADILQLDMDYVIKMQQEETEAILQQEERDRAAAYALQEEEVDNLGVTLTSPTEHQRKLLALLKPKSPMQLRNKSINTVQKNKTPKQKSVKHYFKPEGLENRGDSPCSSKHQSDYELAVKLQSEFYSERQRKKSTLINSNPSVT